VLAFAIDRKDIPGTLQVIPLSGGNAKVCSDENREISRFKEAKLIWSA